MVLKVRGGPHENFMQRQAGSDYHDGERYNSPHQYFVRKADRYMPFRYRPQWEQPTLDRYVNDPYYYNPYDMWRGPFVSARNRAATAAFAMQDEALLCADLLMAKSTAEAAMVHARRYLKLARALRKGDVDAVKKAFNKKNRSDTLSELPSAWLEMQFVLKPLHGTAKSMLQIVDNPLPWQKVRSIGVADVPYRTLAPDAQGTIVNCSKLMYYCRGYCRLDNPNQDFIARSGLTDVVGLIYDLTPWTWAIDYFTNLGDLVASINPRYKDLVWEQRTHGYRCNFTELTQSRTWATWPSSIDSHGVAVECFTRYADAFPGITAEITFDLNLSQFANLSSAIALTLKGKFK